MFNHDEQLMRGQETNISYRLWNWVAFVFRRNNKLWPLDCCTDLGWPDQWCEKFLFTALQKLLLVWVFCSEKTILVPAFGTVKWLLR